jgi:hypothetical protein
MKPSTILVSFFSSSASATGILLPLYYYPDHNTQAWQPVYDAVGNHSDVPWLVVINPGNGPGGTFQPGNNDSNYIKGMAELNSHLNVHTIGYVRTNNGRSPIEEVKANITAWNNWQQYPKADIWPRGIFFDEAMELHNAPSNVPYITEVVKFARDQFSVPITTICNFAAKPAAEYYAICDVVIAFESCLTKHINSTVCSHAPNYEDRATLDVVVPDKTFRNRSSILIHEFTGSTIGDTVADENLLKTMIKSLKEYDIGWGFFTGKGWEHGNTFTPATIGNVAKFMATV